MLVLRIIFLITIPVVTNTIPVKLPNERNQPSETKPKDIVIAVDKEGQMYWGTAPIPDLPTLLSRLKVEAVKVPQPEVHIRGDQEARYQTIGQIGLTCQRAGIAQVGLIDRESVVEGKRVSVRVDLGGRRIIKKQKNKIKNK